MEKMTIEQEFILKNKLADAIKNNNRDEIVRISKILNIPDEQIKYFSNGLTGYPSIDQPWKKYYDQVAFDSVSKISLDRTVWDVIEEKLLEYYDLTAIEYFKKQISTQEFIDNVYVWARTFKAMGVQPDEVVPIYGIFVPDICAMALALNAIGATPTFLKLAISPKALEEETREAKIAVVYDGMWANVAEEFSKDKFKKIIVATVQQDMPSPKKEIVSFLSYIQAKKNKSLIPDEKKYIWLDEAKKIADYYTGEVKEKFVPNRNAFITYSSGTTVGGIVKGTVATNESTLAQLKMAEVSYIDYNVGDTCLNNLPPTASTSLNVLFLYALYKGLTIKLDPRVSEKDFYNQIINNNPNVVLTTGSMWETFFDRVKKEMDEGKKFDFSYAKGWFIGGEGTDFRKYKEWNQIMRQFNAKNELFSGYGSSELFSAISMEKPNARTEQSSELLSVGIPYAGINIGVFDSDGKELPYNSRGELWINSKTAMKEYYQKPELTNKVLKDGWVYSGDMAKIDENGFIYIYGRLTDKISLENGQDVYLFDISNELKKYDFIDDAVVLSLPTEDNKYNLVSHIVWNKNVTNEDKAKNIELMNSAIANKFDGMISIGGFFEHNIMLPYSETTLKQDKNAMSNQLDGYINLEDSEIVDVDYSRKVLKK